MTFLLNKVYRKIKNITLVKKYIFYYCFIAKG